jgi:ferredoxin
VEPCLVWLKPCTQNDEGYCQVSLFDAAERLSALDRSAVVLDKLRCLHSQDRFSNCEACFQVCPVSAITPGKPPVLEQDKCEQCLACLVTCPVGAFAADDSVIPLLNATLHLEEGPLELLCEKNPSAPQGISAKGTGIRVKGCLAGLGTGALLALSIYDIENIFVRKDACPTCQWGTLSKQVDLQVDQAKQLLESWGRSHTLTCLSGLTSPVERPLWEAANPPISRRDLFRMLAQQGKVAMARTIDQGDQGSTHSPGRDRRRLINAVKQLSTDKAEGNPILTDGTFVTLSVSDSCTGCGVCARACPTGALNYQKDAEETKFKLTLSPQLCIGCEFCAHVCVPEAISFEKDPSFEHVFSSPQESLLQEGQLAHCEKCKTAFAAVPGTQFCQVCTYRRSNPFGSILPPALRTPNQSLPGKRQP